jgi:hypothetical protein
LVREVDVVSFPNETMDEKDEEDQRDHHHRNLRTERHQVVRETASSVKASQERESNTDSSERRTEATQDKIEYVDLMCLYTDEALQAECRHMKIDNCEKTYKSVDVIRQMEIKCSHGVQKTVSSL